jgi:2-polyprenyl-3-methyl-5-hydroxy-6-metoxy-1,4-benzoquinol methylase
VYKLTLTTKESLVHLLNTTFLLCAFFASFNRHVWQFDKTMCERLISIMHTSDVPYYVRYRFVGQFLNRTTFPKMCAALTSRPSKHYESVVFHEGTTADHRRDMIRGLLDFKRPILEIGCGEGFYTVPFAQRVNPLPLVAIDVDETILAQTRHKCATKNLTNVSFHPSLDAFLDATSKVQERDKTVYDIICSEVVEHMPQKDAEKLITQVMEHVAFRSFIITTPNSDFNRFYELSPEEMRHDDHDFELGTIEFQAWINKLLAPFASASCTWKFVPVGDIVDGVACSHGLIITRQ